MRVLQVMAGARHGGAEAFFCRLVPALGRAGIEQRAVIRSYPERTAALRDAAIETVELPFGGPIDVATRWRLRQEIRRFRPAIVVTWMNRATSFCPSGRSRTRSARRFVHIGRLGGYYDLRHYRRCDRLIANTRDLVRYVAEQGFPASKAHYIPNFAAETPAEPLPRETVATPAHAKVVLAMGRLHRNKAFDVLLRAVARLPQAYLWLAGEGPERGRLEALASELGLDARVRFLGWRTDGAALMQSADVFVCPSRHEPLGNVVLEAWRQGIPVVAAASQGPGVLIRNAENGLLVPIDDAVALAGAVNAVLGDPDAATRLGAAGRAAYDGEFTEARVVRRYLDVFSAAADAR